MPQFDTDLPDDAFDFDFDFDTDDNASWSLDDLDGADDLASLRSAWADAIEA